MVAAAHMSVADINSAHIVKVSGQPDAASAHQPYPPNPAPFHLEKGQARWLSRMGKALLAA
jgi:hypothetical protein